MKALQKICGLFKRWTDDKKVVPERKPTASYEDKVLAEKMLRKYDRDTKRFNVNCLFEDWIKKAVPVLTQIIGSNLDKLDGLEFKRINPGCSFVYTSGTDMYRLIIKNGTVQIESYDSHYPDEKTYEDFSDIHASDPNLFHSLAFRILHGMTLYGKERNDYRNQFVHSLERKTGRNLKKEVASQ